MLSRLKVRSVTSSAAIPELAQQIVGKCRLIHSSKVGQSRPLWQQLCCSLSLPAQLHSMLLQIPQVAALLHELLQRDSGSLGAQVKPGQFAIAYSECHCSTGLPSCPAAGGVATVLHCCWHGPLSLVWSCLCLPVPAQGMLWQCKCGRRLWHLQAAPTSSSCGNATRNALQARRNQSLSSQPCWSTWIHTL